MELHILIHVEQFFLTSVEAEDFARVVVSVIGSELYDVDDEDTQHAGYG